MPLSCTWHTAIFCELQLYIDFINGDGKVGFWPSHKTGVGKWNNPFTISCLVHTFISKPRGRLQEVSQFSILIFKTADWLISSSQVQNCQWLFFFLVSLIFPRLCLQCNCFSVFYILTSMLVRILEMLFLGFLLDIISNH